MTRRMKCRRIGSRPAVSAFKPAGVRMKDIEQVVLQIDEFEAFRLAHKEKLYQEDAAKLMNVSRQTFGNILARASEKIADVLVHGKSLLIEGGQLEPPEEDTRHFRCESCGLAVSIPFGELRPTGCPTCGSDKFHRQ